MRVFVQKILRYPVEETNIRFAVKRNARLCGELRETNAGAKNGFATTPEQSKTDFFARLEIQDDMTVPMHSFNVGVIRLQIDELTGVAAVENLICEVMRFAGKKANGYLVSGKLLSRRVVIPRLVAIRAAVTHRS